VLVLCRFLLHMLFCHPLLPTGLDASLTGHAASTQCSSCFAPMPNVSLTLASPLPPSPRPPSPPSPNPRRTLFTVR
jgi:hypothetical protein